ncbi:uncharacterized protein ACWYII_009372 [Salvelinus alpinus]
MFHSFLLYPLNYRSVHLAVLLLQFQLFCLQLWNPDLFTRCATCPRPAVFNSLETAGEGQLNMKRKGDKEAPTGRSGANRPQPFASPPDPRAAPYPRLLRVVRFPPRTQSTTTRDDTETSGSEQDSGPELPGDVIETLPTASSTRYAVPKGPKASFKWIVQKPVQELVYRAPA